MIEKIPLKSNLPQHIALILLLKSNTMCKRSYNIIFDSEWLLKQL